MFHDSAQYSGFSWHTHDVVFRASVRQALAQARQARQTAVKWDEATEIEDGGYLVWKAPVTWKAAWQWFQTRLSPTDDEAEKTKLSVDKRKGKLKVAPKEEEQKRQKMPKIVAHPSGFDPERVRQAKEDDIDDEVTGLPRDKRKKVTGGMLDGPAEPNGMLDGPDRGCPEKAAGKPDGRALNGGRLHCLKGQRHDWNTCVGQAPPEVVKWLLEDPDLEKLLAGASFSTETPVEDRKKGFRYEHERKMAFAGRLCPCATSSMHGVPLQTNFLRRVCAWREAFCSENERVFDAADDRAKVLIRRLRASGGDWSENTQFCNGTHFLQTHWRRYLNTCGEVHLTDGGDTERGFWVEDHHNDGAASAIQLAIALAGRKYIKFAQPSDGGRLDRQGDDVFVDSEPGTVYFGGITGATHQVVHREAAAHELVEVPSVGRRCSIAIMMRTALFPHCRSRDMNQTPSPWSAFECLTRVWRETLASAHLQLPSLEKCKAAYASQFGPCDQTHRLCIDQTHAVGSTGSAPKAKAKSSSRGKRELKEEDAHEDCTRISPSPSEASSGAGECKATRVWWCVSPLLKYLELEKNLEIISQPGTTTSSSFATAPERGERLGGGSYGDVFSVKSSDAVVLKVPKSRDQRWELAEIHGLEKGRGHPHIVQLLDIAVEVNPPFYRICLVLERCALDLRAVIEHPSWTRRDPPPQQIRRIASQVSSGLLHLHSAGLVHTDLKPGNILVQSLPDWLAAGPVHMDRKSFDVKVGDLGSVLPAEPCERAVDKDKLLDRGLQLQTLGFRAPEVVFGDPGFSRPVDAWSLGIVLCLTAGVLNPSPSSLGGNSEVGYMMFLVNWLGTPTGFEHLPHWPRRGRPEIAAAKPWPELALRALGPRGVDFLRRLLRYPPAERLTMDDAVRADYLFPERFPLGGRFAAPEPFLPQGVLVQSSKRRRVRPKTEQTQGPSGSQA